MAVQIQILIRTLIGMETMEDTKVIEITFILVPIDRGKLAKDQLDQKDKMVINMIA